MADSEAMGSNLPDGRGRQQIFDQLCRNLGITTGAQRDRLTDLISSTPDLRDDWSTVMAMSDEGPLDSYSSDDLAFIACLQSKGLTPKTLFEEAKEAMLKDHYDVDSATLALERYNGVIGDNVAKFEAHLSRRVTSLQDLSSVPTNQSTHNKSLEANLLRRKELLESSIADLEARAQRRYGANDYSGAQSSNIVGFSTFGGRQALYEGLVLGKDSTAKAPSHPEQLWNVDTIKDECTRAFASYDHILDKLKRIHEWQSGLDLAEDDAVMHEARQVAAKTILTIANSCRHTLDIVFQEAAASRSAEPPDYLKDSNHAKERGAILAEIQSLWDEIDPVAHMAVEGEYLRPILERIDMNKKGSRLQDAGITKYTSDVLRYMNDRLAVLAKRMQLIIHHQLALATTYNYMRTAASDLTVPQPITFAIEDKFPYNSATDAIQQYLSVHGAGPLDITPTTSGGGTTAVLTDLEKHVYSRADKGDTQARELHSFFEAAFREEMSDSETGGQVLLNSLLGDCGTELEDHGAVFKDVQLDASVIAMRDEVQQVRLLFQALQSHDVTSPPDYVARVYKVFSEQAKAESDRGSLQNGIQCQELQEFVKAWK